jgi:hypothetical protein
LLSAEAQQRVPRAGFEAALPDGFMQQRGASVNSITGTVGTAVGAQACVDGSISLPQGGSIGFIFELKSTNDGWRIHNFDRQRTCRR